MSRRRRASSRPGQPTKFKFTVHHPLTGAQAQRLRADARQAVSPVRRSAATCRNSRTSTRSITPTARSPSSTRCRKAGHYMLFSDFLPMGGGAQVAATPLVTAGVDTDIIASQAKLTPDAVDQDGRRREGRDSERAGGDSRRRRDRLHLPLHRRRRPTRRSPTSSAISAPSGTCSILSEDMTEYVHAHPREETQPDPNAPPTGGPEVLFDALLPKPGRYRRGCSSSEAASCRRCRSRSRRRARRDAVRPGKSPLLARRGARRP